MSHCNFPLKVHYVDYSYLLHDIVLPSFLPFLPLENVV